MFLKFKQWLIQFMYGRNGADAISVTSAIIYLVLAVLNSFLRSKIIAVIETALIVYSIFRIFSKNLTARRAENQKFLVFVSKLTPHFILMRDRIKERKISRFRRCPNCKAVLRLPVKKGKHDVRCPKCGNMFKVNIIF